MPGAVMKRDYSAPAFYFLGRMVLSQHISSHASTQPQSLSTVTARPQVPHTYFLPVLFLGCIFFIFTDDVFGITFSFYMMLPLFKMFDHVPVILFWQPGVEFPEPLQHPRLFLFRKIAHGGYKKMSVLLFYMRPVEFAQSLHRAENL